jgi:hypothetical protein
VETSLSRLMMETMLNPIVYCSCASSKVQVSGPHCTRNSSTCVNRRLCLILLGSARAKTLSMEALPPGASLPRRGSMVVAGFLLEVAFLLGPRVLFVLKWRTMRVPSVRVGREVEGMFLMASSMVGCLEAVLTARGEGLSGMLSQALVKMALHRGAMVGVNEVGPDIEDLKRRQSSEFFEESSVLRNLSARATSFCRGKVNDGLAHWSSLSSRKPGRPLSSIARI